MTSRAPIRAALAVGLLAVAADLAIALTGGGRAGEILYSAIELLGVALLMGRVIAERRDRAAWVLLTISVALWSGGDLVWTVWLDNVAAPPAPSVADGLYYASYVPLYVGLALLLRARCGRTDAGLWLDALVGAITLAAVAVALLLAPMLRMADGSGWLVATTLGYPLLDTALVGVVLVGFGLLRWRPGRVWSLLAVAQLISALGDAVYCYQQAAGTYRPQALVDTSWPLAVMVMAVAAWQRPERHHATAGAQWRAVLLPGAFGALALALLAGQRWQETPALTTVLAAAAIVLAGARAACTFADNRRLYAATRHESRHDALSGLPNRRALLADLDAALADGAPRVLAFFDLDGFKGYNDSFGHAAGDALLRRLSARLGRAAAPAARAYRLGGDEFCLLTHRGRADADIVLAGAVAALSEHGEGFSVTPSTGAVLLPAEASTSSEALRLADERMYAEKGSRAGSSRRQARDVLLALIDEREPDLAEHNHDVTRLCAAVAERLGLSRVEVDVLLRAAELHDVGKSAIPDRVLHKPGPLDEDEWTLMRQHTVIGARILNVAAALQPVAELVRASHERLDGAGYPDGLAGTAIPIGARIIAVCDSYDAMVTDRPYRRGMAPELALAELERCAGTQFDPQVVAAFTAAHRQATAVGVQPPHADVA